MVRLLVRSTEQELQQPGLDGNIQKWLVDGFLETMTTEVGRLASAHRPNDEMRNRVRTQLLDEIGEHGVSKSALDSRRAANKKWAVVKQRIIDDAVPIFEKNVPRPRPHQICHSQEEEEAQR